jgi:hypothetical protein
VTDTNSIDTKENHEVSDYRATQTNVSTDLMVDVQMGIDGGASWKSVHTLWDGDDPDKGAREWLAANRDANEQYRIARRVRTVLITVDPA